MSSSTPQRKQKKSESSEIMTTSMETLTPKEKESMYEVALILVEFSQQVDEEKKDHEEEDEDEDDDEETMDHDDHEFKLLPLPPNKTHGKKHKNREPVEVDDSEETLSLILRWNAFKPDNPRGKFFFRDPNALGECSRPIRKQLTKSDVEDDQSRLMLKKMQVKNMMHDVVGESEKPGPKHRINSEVSVYGPDGEVHEMMFKMWGKNGNTPVLTSGWKKFVKKYELKMHRDFITMWMFRHKETRQMCFAIDKTTFSSIEKPLSRRISKKAAF